MSGIIQTKHIIRFIHVVDFESLFDISFERFIITIVFKNTNNVILREEMHVFFEVYLIIASLDIHSKDLFVPQENIIDNTLQKFSTKY